MHKTQEILFLTYQINIDDEIISFFHFVFLALFALRFDMLNMPSG